MLKKIKPDFIFIDDLDTDTGENRTYIRVGGMTQRIVMTVEDATNSLSNHSIAYPILSDADLLNIHYNKLEDTIQQIQALEKVNKQHTMSSIQDNKVITDLLDEFKNPPDRFYTVEEMLYGTSCTIAYRVKIDGNYHMASHQFTLPNGLPDRLRSALTKEQLYNFKRDFNQDIKTNHPDYYEELRFKDVS